MLFTTWYSGTRNGWLKNEGIVDAQLKLAATEKWIAEPFVLVLCVGNRGAGVLHFVGIVESYHKKVEVNSNTTAGAYGSLVPLMRSSTAAVPTLVFEKTASGEEVPRLVVSRFDRR